MRSRIERNLQVTRRHGSAKNLLSAAAKGRGHGFQKKAISLHIKDLNGRVRCRLYQLLVASWADETDEQAEAQAGWSPE